MQKAIKVADFLLPSEIAIINDVISKSRVLLEDDNFGRIIYDVTFPSEVTDRIQADVEKLLGKKLRPISASYVEYRSEYGQPNLPPHFDGDNNDLIIDYQLKSNTSWGLGVDGDLYEMNDNDAIMFNPNEYPHWRPYKTFQEGEYVGMIFFRFVDFSWKEVDYSHKRLSQEDSAFDVARAARELTR